jgi:hypothetical protein
MLKLAADENLNGAIVRGILRRRSDLDLIRVRDAGLRGADDPTILAWAAAERRVLLTHDVSTMTRHAYERVAKGLPMPGVFELGRGVSVRQAIEDVLLIVERSESGEWEGQVRYLPL